MGHNLHIFDLLGFFSKRNAKAGAVSQANEVSHEPKNPTGPPPIVGIVGAKGGVGASTLAFNLAVAMSGLDEQVTLIDSDFQRPALSVLTAHEPVYTIADLLSKGSHIESNIFEACTYGIEGLTNSPRFLVPPNDSEGAVALVRASLANLLERICSFSSLWIIDLPKEIDRHLIEVLDLCSQIVLVVEPDLSSVAAARRWLNHFEDLGYDPDKVLIVANRSGGRMREVEKQMVSNFSRWTLVSVPNAYESLQQCCLNGKALVLEHPGHSYSKSVKALSSLIKQRSQAQTVKSPVQA